METPRQRTLKTARDLILVGLGQFFVGALMRASGFLALSDDDYARVTIAQRFVEHPSFDPSGTSWLPFPFWVQGLAMDFFGGTLEVAREVAFALALASAFLLYRAARLLRAPRLIAVTVSLGIAVLPTLRPLALATVPEYFCHASLAYALAALGARRSTDLVFGALLLFFATLSRYEVWPAALVYAALAFLASKPANSARKSLVFAGCLALLGPLLWSLHGAVHHHSLTFYVTRVRAYKEALGTDQRALFELWTSVPWAALRTEPEPWLLLAATLVLGRGKGRAKEPRFPWKELALPTFALFLGLWCGDLRGGAPTHHPERTLGCVWMVSALGAAVLLPRLGYLRGATAVLLGLALALPLRLTAQATYYGARPEEEAVGHLLRKEPKDAKIVVATTDYGYFAILAAAGHPGRFSVLDTHDPRDRGKPMPIPPRVIAKASETGACLAVLPLCVEMNGITPLVDKDAFSIARLTRAGCP